MLPNTDRPRPMAIAARTEDEVSIWAYANMVLRRRRLLIWLPPILAVASLLYSVLKPKEFTARTSFIPMESGKMGSMAGLAGLASQLGVSQLGALGGGSTGSAQFYADLLSARELELAAIRTVYKTHGPNAFAGNLIRYFGLDDADSVRREVKALKKFNSELVSVSFDRLTSVVHVAVTTKNPELSALVARRLLDLTNQFNLQRRKTQATAEQQFVEEQSSDAAAVLRNAEDALTSFQAGNRNVFAPQLAAEQRRRERAVDMARQLYLGLMQQQAATRMESARSTPVIAVIDSPESLVEPTRPQHVVAALVGYMAGVVLVIAYAFLAESMARARERNAEEYAEFRRLRGGESAGLLSR